MKISRSFRNELKPQRVFLHLGKKKKKKQIDTLIYLSMCARLSTQSPIYTLCHYRKHTHTHTLYLRNFDYLQFPLLSFKKEKNSIVHD